MDIPTSGAIFTLGKSYLAENTQSYFYIKNDPVKRLISGPHQSAVICDSGRLFVWGENHFGQLGIGNNHNNGTDHNDITTKPTCVKSLKVLGVKVRDIAFGNDWAVVLTYSNEVFFSGRSIFSNDTIVSANFSTKKILGEECDFTSNPFRLEEFDSFLSTNEETENFISILAGNEHFVVLTSFGRLIGWGSNKNHQLGTLENAALLAPHELKIDAQVQQFVCGPESTLVLTENGTLYLTGQLNDFMFPQFTELQKNLTANEQIIFMHISKASEIFIVTNSRNIYRSFESVRNKSLIFQRFYDYDSEEHGPIWKLLKGFSFYAVLTKANKFYTTFSESGHHLKTFREISKFKNLRLLDMAVGNQHVLVHGIPRSSTLSATVGLNGKHRFSSRSFAMLNSNGGNEDRAVSVTNLVKDRLDARTAFEDENENPTKDNDNENNNGIEKQTQGVYVNAMTAEVEPTTRKTIIEEPKKVETAIEPTTTEEATTIEEPTAIEVPGKMEEPGIMEEPAAIEIPTTLETPTTIKDPAIAANVAPDMTVQTEALTKLSVEVNDQLTIIAGIINVDPVLANNWPNNESNAASSVTSDSKSPTISVKSYKSLRSIKFDPAALQKVESNEKLLRPHTPYPDSSANTTPQTIKKTPLRNFSYETAMEDDFIEHTSPIPLDSLDNIEEHEAEEHEHEAPPVTAIVSSRTLPTEEDEQLVVEINTTTDELNRTVVNEIRFINNGIDVTANFIESTPDLPDSLEETDVKLDDQISEMAKQVLQTNEHTIKATENGVEADITHSKDTFSNKVDEKLSDARSSVKHTAQKAVTGARETVDSVGENAKRVANDARQAMEAMSTDALKATVEARRAIHQVFKNVADDTKHAFGSVSTKISNEMHEATENLTNILKNKGGETSDTNSKEIISSSVEGFKTNTAISVEDDERTTASVNSTQTSTGNPFETNNPFENSNLHEGGGSDELDDIVERSKMALRGEVDAAQQHVVKMVAEETEHAKGKVRQFLDDVRAKGKSMSCRNEKAIRIADELPRYTETDELKIVQHGNGNGNQNTSTVCSIL